MGSILALTLAMMQPLEARALEDKKPERIVKGAAITSLKDPKIEIRLPKRFRYAGAARWDLNDVADCEMHLFVDADKNRRVKSYVWVQFEGYLDSAPNGIYAYKGGSMMNLGSREFNVRARFGKDEVPKAGSDAERAFQLIRSAGFSLPSELMNVRFVHLLPGSRDRKELMIIYGEDMSLVNLKFEDCIDGDKPSRRWFKEEGPLIERAKSTLKFE